MDQRTDRVRIARTGVDSQTKVGSAKFEKLDVLTHDRIDFHCVRPGALQAPHVIALLADERAGHDHG